MAISNKAFRLLNKVSQLSIADLIRFNNAISEPSELTESPLIIDYEGIRVAPNVCTLSTVEFFSPLADRQSGGGLTTISQMKLGFDAKETISMQIVVSPLTKDEADSCANDTGKMAQLVKEKALSRIRPMYNLFDGKGPQPYTGKAVMMPDGTVPLYWETTDGKLVASRILAKNGFTFGFEGIDGPTVATLIGADPKTCTRVQVDTTLKGVWIGVSEAEKFAATMAKLCLDPFVIPNNLEDLVYGGIALYDGGLDYTDILLGNAEMLPFPHVITGQETMKSASSAEEAAQYVKVASGESVIRPSIKVDGFKGLLTADDDDFVEFRNQFVQATKRRIWVCRWVDSDMLPIYQKSMAKAIDDGRLIIQPLGDGAILLHHCDARLVSKPFTIETSTQLENCNARATGRMFQELQSVAEGMSGPMGVIARILAATANEDKTLAATVPTLMDRIYSPGIVDGMYNTGNQRIGDNGVVPVWDALTYLDLPVECDPLTTFDAAAKDTDEEFVLKYEDKYFLVSLKVARSLGYTPGGNLELYAQVVHQLLLTLNMKDKTSELFGREMKQWMAAYNTTLKGILEGGETTKMQAKCGLYQKGTRAKGVCAAKMGSLVMKGLKRGYLYVSEDSPFAAQRGQLIMWWRNPMPFLGLMKVAVVGSDPNTCDVVVPDTLLGKALAKNKVYTHPIDTSRTFGDIDGDGIQFCNVNMLLQWAIGAGREQVQKNPGLWNQMIECGFISAVDQ